MYIHTNECFARFRILWILVDLCKHYLDKPNNVGRFCLKCVACVACIQFYNQYGASRLGDSMVLTMLCCEHLTCTNLITDWTFIIDIFELISQKRCMLWPMFLWHSMVYRSRGNTLSLISALYLWASVGCDVVCCQGILAWYVRGLLQGASLITQFAHSFLKRWHVKNLV